MSAEVGIGLLVLMMYLSLLISGYCDRDYEQ